MENSTCLKAPFTADRPKSTVGNLVRKEEDFHGDCSKKTTRFNWDDVRVFAGLAECGTLSATARMLKITHVTVARRLAELETAIGHTLFERKSEGYHLTAIGKEVLREAIAMEHAALRLTELGQTDEQYHLIRISATHSLSDHWLVSRLKFFSDRYPMVNFEIQTEARNISLAHREADIAIRLARPMDSDNVGRSLGKIHFALFGRQDVVEHFYACNEANFIGFSDDHAHLPEAAWIDSFARGARFVLRTNSILTQLSAVRDGRGLAILPLYLVTGIPELMRVSLTEPIPVREVWIMARRNLLRKAPVRRLFDFLLEAFQADRALFTGAEALTPFGLPPEAL